jgi:hypothetical protein
MDTATSLMSLTHQQKLAKLSWGDQNSEKNKIG